MGVYTYGHKLYDGYPWSFPLGQFDTHKKLGNAINSLKRLNNGFSGVENIREALATRFERMLWYNKCKILRIYIKNILIQIVSKI